MSEAFSPAPVLELRNLTKAFSGVRVLEEVSLQIFAGEVHAIMGENGAGKSTLMKIISGLERADSGELVFGGKSRRDWDPGRAIKAGIAMIHQELTPIARLTVAENLFLGRELQTGLTGRLAKPAMEREAAQLLTALGMSITARRSAGSLRMSELQELEIAKAVSRRAQVVIMDEPTSSLAALEVEGLFRIIADLRRQGIAILYITHKMDEVFRIADRITVLRDGRRISTDLAGQLDSAALITRMVGRPLSARPPATAARRGSEALAADRLSRRDTFRDISFSISGGEIVGVAGLMGSGRSELLGSICGMEALDGGQLRVAGRPVRLDSPRAAIRAGLGWVGEDRKATGLVLGLSVKHNLTLAGLQACSRGPRIVREEENRCVDRMIREFGIKASGRDQPVSTLSGGNQQKVVLAKVLFTRPKILVLDEPTRGVDIGAKAEIHALIRQFAEQGGAVLVVSSELPELLGLTTRLLIMRCGEIAGEVDPRTATQEEVLRFAIPS